MRFLLQKGLLQRMLKQKIFTLWWHQQIKPVEGGNNTFPIRCSFVVQRRSRLGDSRTPSPLWSMPVVCLQGEEDVDDSCVVFLILLPRSQRQKSWWSDWSPVIGSLWWKKCEPIILEHDMLRGVESSSCNLPGGTIPPAGPWVHMTCDFSRFSKSIG